MMPHPIRLRHPWDEVPAAAPGKIAYRRRFNRPTGLEADEIVTAEVDRIVFRGEISLNGKRLGELEPGEFFSADITALLKDTNELVAEIDPQSRCDGPPVSHSIYIVDETVPPGSPIGEARIVIRAKSTSGD